MLKLDLIRAAQRRSWPAILAIAVVTIAATLAACKPAPTPEEHPATFRLKGKVLSVDPTNGYVEVDAKAIPGYMNAMSMPYQVVDSQDLKRLKEGDEIKATLLVTQAGPKLEDIVVTSEGNGAPRKTRTGPLQLRRHIVEDRNQPGSPEKQGIERRASESELALSFRGRG